MSEGLYMSRIAIKVNVVAGDIRSGSARQAITATGAGATAAVAAEKFIALKSK
jgi:thioredoxin reductase